MKCHPSIIYTGLDAPAPSPDGEPNTEIGEYGMLNAIRVVPERNTHTIDPVARLDYNKLYSVPHNVKVYNFGKVHDDFLIILKKQFGWVWKMQDDNEDGNDESSIDGRDDEEEDAEEPTA
jgi:hypothetical protein